MNFSDNIFNITSAPDLPAADVIFPDQAAQGYNTGMMEAFPAGGTAVSAQDNGADSLFKQIRGAGENTAFRRILHQASPPGLPAQRLPPGQGREAFRTVRFSRLPEAF